MNGTLPIDQYKLLGDLDKIKLRLIGSDREDHVREVFQWETDAKDAIITLNLQENEGIKSIVKNCQQEINEINSVLANSKIGDSAVSGQISSIDHNALIDKREMWEWFLSFFQSAKSTIEHVKGRVDEQGEAKPEFEDDEVIPKEDIT